MIAGNNQKFKEIWVIDFEYIALHGNRPEVVCLVAWELISRRTIRLWQDKLNQLSSPPYGIGEDSLIIAYYASAESNCHLALGWELPVNTLDLFTEFRNLTNGKTPPDGNGLLSAMKYHGLDSIGLTEKEVMRDLILGGKPWSDKDQQAILDYCESDVEALSRLYPLMIDSISLPHALLRGRYMQAAARIEHQSIPVDANLLSKTLKGWPNIQHSLITAIDADYGVYQSGSFKSALFCDYLKAHNIRWPRTRTGRLDLADKTFKLMVSRHPQLAQLRLLRKTLAQLRSSNISIGDDNRNRYMLSAFSSRTGRNQPRSSQALFGSAVWMRGFIKPEEGMAIAYIDWSQQEFGIAAALSGDVKMMDAYASGDPYMEFAKQAGAVPSDATKVTHKSERALFKECVLAVQYGMTYRGLALRIGQSESQAKKLLKLHRMTYKTFWHWSEGNVDYAMLHNELHTTFGWKIHIKAGPNARFLQNFLMQANGAEMLRLACILATESGIKICAPIHDAVLIEAPINEIDQAVVEMQLHMEEASKLVLDGFKLRSDVDVFSYPDRYMDPRGKDMWNKVMKFVDDSKQVA